jgi:hypothetical protein
MTLESLPAGLDWQSDSDSELLMDKPSFVAGDTEEGTTQARELNAVFKVWASREATIGRHTVTVTMRYEAGRSTGSKEEELTIRIPVRVVAAGADVKVHEVSPEDQLKLK